MVLSFQDVVRRYKEMHSDWEDFPNKVAFQMNDTHPTLLGEMSAGAKSLMFPVALDTARARAFT